MKSIDIVKGDDVYLELVRSDKNYSQWTFQNTTVDDLIETTNYINSHTDEKIDVSLVGRGTDYLLRVFKDESKEVLAEYEILPLIDNSIIEYCWKNIKLK